ncbi:hypothetical protein BCY76_012670 [Nesterenkonia sp. PF2B19]|nr:hypothetical protein BCY76_012670 [Nesterenkonia sp. PF2B19]
MVWRDDGRINVDRINMTPQDGPRRLTSVEVAGRLGIKVETLYAYVSRGRISCTRTQEGSLFDPLEVEAFAARNRPRPLRRHGASTARPLMVLDTDLALVEDDELYLRGQSASDLARTSTVERVAAWIWHGDWEAPLSSPPTTDLAQVATLLASLPAGADRIDQLQAAAIGLGTTDPGRDEISQGALQRAGARFLHGVPRLLGDPFTPGVETRSVAETLWLALTPHPPRPEHVRAVDAALILTIDHDLAISTFAGRIAASGRASGYAVLSAALGAFASPLHGSISVTTVQLLRSVLDGAAPEDALRTAVRSSAARLPGFGHFLYADGDSRATTLLELIPDLPHGAEVTAAVTDLTEVVNRRSSQHPNIDLALAALVLAAGMHEGDGPLLFGLGRSVGWIAHGLAEQTERPLRLRPQGRYTGP